MKIIVFIAISIITSSSGQLFMRAGAIEYGDSVIEKHAQIGEWIKLILNWKILAGIFLWGVSSVAYIAVLSSMELSLAYCLGSLNYLIIPIMSCWLFGESLNLYRIGGIAIIFTGVALTIYGKYVDVVKVADL